MGAHTQSLIKAHIQQEGGESMAKDLSASEAKGLNIARQGPMWMSFVRMTFVRMKDLL